MFKAATRAVVIAATGVCLFASGPSRAIESDVATHVAQAESETEAPVDLKKPARRVKSARRTASRKAARAEKTAAAKQVKTASVAVKQDSSKAIEGASSDTSAARVAAPVTMADAGSATIPASVANANAQWVNTPQTAADAAAQNMSAQASSLLQLAKADGAPPAATGNTLANPDQLNDLDRSAGQTGAPSIKLAMVSAQESQSAPVSSAVVASASSDSTWNQTSLIGKVFIAFGGLLTMASAARMFFA